MHTDYSGLINESSKNLISLERKLRGQKAAVRIQMLRLLKSGKVANMEDCAFLIGYSPRTAKRWWKTYKDGGIQELMREAKYKGKSSQLSPDMAESVRRAIMTGEIQTLESARTYLKNHHGVEYQSVNGVWHILKRHNIKLR